VTKYGFCPNCQVKYAPFNYVKKKNKRPNIEFQSDGSRHAKVAKMSNEMAWPEEGIT
jgi:hypothetical protein